MDTTDQTPRFDLVSTWEEECGIFEYASALIGEKVLSERIEVVFARRLKRAEGLAQSSPDRTPPVDRCWATGDEPQTDLLEKLKSSRSDALWFQYHPSFFTKENLSELGQALKQAGYRQRVLTVHNPEGLAGTGFTSAFTHIIVHNEQTLVHLPEDVRPKSKVIPHFIYSREMFEPQETRDTFTLATVGFVAQNKQVPLLIEAFSMAHALYADMELHVLSSPFPTHASHFELSKIAAAIRHSPAKAAIKSDLSHKTMSQVLGDLSASDLLCLPYADTAESASGAARLGLAAGVPILRSESSIFSDLPGGDIVLTDCRPETIAEAILTLSQLPVLLSQKSAEIDSIYDEQNVSQTALRIAELLNENGG
ncbi:hypothetical protein INR77_13725 [Erythrobacter sp. SCSIO 43205]|uniref:hypothetical protein n=1 Tax=Erythrobacter sp. SCSIO 43205 TaxID=2779361 RepID=UPI001CA9480F|nr:hypothetical protein [Erythrobacter sp. SCSIO 43205]UAB77821.1 hypothetical protein INR77_13725 [Erythrobacter sp. SCSIO 43205]